MVRVKGVRSTHRRQPGETRLPRATFPNMDLHPAQRQCKLCGLVVRKGNMARHRRIKHSGSRHITGSSDPVYKHSMDHSVEESNSSQNTEEVTEPSFEPSKPVAAVTPEAALTRTQESSKCQRLIIKLPAVDEAINKVMDSYQSPQVVNSHLPPTPETEEDLHRELARLYSRKVKANQRDTQISYNDTSVILAIARDPCKRDGLKEILDSAGLTLLTQEEYHTLSKAAEEQASTPPEQPKSRTPHPLVVSTTHQEGQPQVVSIHMGGQWGIRLTHYEL